MANKLNNKIRLSDQINQVKVEKGWIKKLIKKIIKK
jgi:DNA-binding MarR family transcriptional regulator